MAGERSRTSGSYPFPMNRRLHHEEAQAIETEIVTQESNAGEIMAQEQGRGDRRSGVGWEGWVGGMAPVQSRGIEKEQDENRAEEQVEGLHEVTSPGDVVAEESGPALAVAGDPLPHVSLHGALRDPDSKLEQLTSKPLGAPPWVSRRHLADQRRVACRPLAASS